jgi:hypothetical protein
MRLVRQDLALKMQIGGSLRRIHHELYLKQGAKCFVCSVSFDARGRTHGRTRVRRKVPAWELAKLDLPMEEICRLANDKDNFILIHKDEMQKLLSRRETIPSSSSSDASIGNADTNTLEAKAPHPIGVVARDPLKNP